MIYDKIYEDELPFLYEIISWLLRTLCARWYKAGLCDSWSGYVLSEWNAWNYLFVFCDDLVLKICILSIVIDFLCIEDLFPSTIQTSIFI